MLKGTREGSSLFATDCFGCHKAAGFYKEDEWTERLFHCLKLKNIDAELTAHYRGYKVEKSWETRIPKAVDYKCLLFQGSPDLIIRGETSREEEGIFTVASDEDVASAHDKDVASDEDVASDVSLCSQESGRIQLGHQMTWSGPYKVGSSLTEKVAELMTALHTGLACRALRRYVKGKKVCSLTAHGLHIHRGLGVTYLQVTLSEQPIEIQATQLIDGIVNAEIFCSAIEFFINKLNQH